MRSEDSKIDDKMKALRQKYLEQLEGRIKEIKLFMESCRGGELDPNLKRTTSETAHKLCGSGATYGFGAISVAARELEESLAGESALSLDELAGKARLLLDACTNARGGMSLRKQSHPALEKEAPRKNLGLPVILCVDDDENIRQLLPLLFQSDAEILLANDGQEALSLIETYAPDMVVLDSNMPNLDGLRLLEILNEKGLKKKMAIIMLTSSKKNAEVVQAFKSGVVDYVVKPFVPAVFHSRVLGLLARSKQKILIADDDVAIRDLLGNKFQSLGYNVFLAEDGESAFALARDNIPNLIILDRMMPGGDGLSVFRNLRDDPKTREIPVLFLTAKRRESDIVEALNQGAQDYVIKPFNIDEVVARCTRFMNVKISGRK